MFTHCSRRDALFLESSWHESLTGRICRRAHTPEHSAMEPLVALSWTWMSHASYPGDHCPRFVLLIQMLSKGRDLLSWSVMKLLPRSCAGSEGGSVPGAHTPAGRARCELGCARASLARCRGAHSKAQPGFISTGVRPGRPYPQTEPALFNCVRKHSLSQFYRRQNKDA